MKLFFVTGSSGVGKSAVLPFLKKHLPKGLEVHDFDEKLTEEVARDGGLLENWRRETTKYWVGFAKENLKLDKSTVIVGLIYPSEVKQLSAQISYDFCLLDASDEKIKERLMGKRFSDDQKIAGLKEATGQTSREFILENRHLMEKLRDETMVMGGAIIDTTEDAPEQTADKILSWILRNN